MNWERATVLIRWTCLILGLASFAFAWRMTEIGKSGIEDIPPLYILLAGFAGLGFACVALTGRYPRPEA